MPKKIRYVLPGFKLSLGFSLFYLTLIVLIPFAALFLKTASGGWESYWTTLSNPRVVAAFQLSFGLAFIASLINGFFGLLMAWALVRYDFPGRKILDAMVDLPFALPTAVAGLALTTLYVPKGLVGKVFKDWLGWDKIAFSPWGILIALTFIGLPFVVRTIQPVMQDLATDLEEAAACLGANRWTTFIKVTLPALLPSLITGATLAFGRAVGEYGSVAFIAGNLPYKTEIAPLLIIIKLDENDYVGAAGIGFTMLLFSLLILAFANFLQWWGAKRQGRSLA